MKSRWWMTRSQLKSDAAEEVHLTVLTSGIQESTITHHRPIRKAAVYSIGSYTLISIYMHLEGTSNKRKQNTKVNPSANIPLQLSFSGGGGG